MKPIVIQQSSSVDYNKNDFGKLLITYVCAFTIASFIVFIDRQNKIVASYNIDSNNLNLYLIIIAAVLIGFYEGFLYFRKYKDRIRNKFYEKSPVNIIWIIMPLSIIVVFFDMSVSFFIFPDISHFLFIVSAIVIIRYHRSLY